MAVGVLLVAVLVYGFLENYWLKVNAFDFYDSDLPKAFVNKKIVFISDLHLGFYFSNKRTNELVTKINQLKPDIIIFGGDFIDRNVKYTEPRFNGLKNLKASLGKFGVLGNHDNVIGPDHIKREMKEAGITLLDNQAQWVLATSTSLSGSTTLEQIKIGGVGDLWTEYQNLQPTLNGAGKEDFVIVVSHNPDYAPIADQTGLVDLTLSGHTHAGQITFFGLWGMARSLYGQKFRYGMVPLNNSSVYITSGVGSTILPVRFFARPEIAVITLKK
ncbi:MAG: metallophosphoesterase [Candidatus Gribaldobacteria bacterium]|nr:metallophosphoesterase [Candidatus Gribaldobacteria bacterium]